MTKKTTTKRRPGGGRKPNPNARRHTIAFRVADDELASLEGELAAHGGGVSVHDYARIKTLEPKDPK